MKSSRASGDLDSEARCRSRLRAQLWRKRSLTLDWSKSTLGTANKESERVRVVLVQWRAALHVPVRCSEHRTGTPVPLEHDSHRTDLPRRRPTVTSLVGIVSRRRRRKDESHRCHR